MYNIKNNIITALSLISLLCLSSCSDDVYQEKGGYLYTSQDVYLTVSTHWYSSISSTGESKSLTVYTDDYGSWFISDMAPWTIFNPTSGTGTSDVNLEIQKNTSTTPRVNISSVALSEFPLMRRTFKIEQNGSIPYLSFRSDLYNYVSAQGEVVEIPVSTNIPISDISVETSGTDDMEINASLNLDKLTVTVGQNKYTKSLQKTIFLKATLSDGTVKSDYIYIKQYAGSVSGNTSLSFKSGSSSQTLSFESDVDWTAVSGDTWIKISPTSGVYGSNNTIVVTVDRNESAISRSGYIRICPKGQDPTSTNYLLRCQVIQSGVSGSSSQSSFEDIAAVGETVTLEFSSETDWVATSDKSFVEILPAAGKAGKTDVKFNILPNTNKTSRSATVSFKSANKGIRLCNIYVHQLGARLYSDPESLTLDSKGNQVELSVYTDVDVTYIEAPDFIHLDRSSLPVGQSTLLVTADRNTDLTSRDGIIKFYWSRNYPPYLKVPVTQEAASLNDESTIHLSWKSQSHTLNITSPEPWSAALSDPSWMSLSAYSGTGDASIDLTVTENTAETSRSGAILISAGATTQTIEVIQQGQYITIESSIAEFTCAESSLDLYVSSSLSLEPVIRYITENAGNDWLSLTVAPGSADDCTVISIKANANPYSFTRNAEIVIAPGKDYNGSVTGQGIIFNVSQAGRGLSASTTEIYSSGAGGVSEQVIVTADGDYTITRDGTSTWFTILSTDDYFTVTTTPNTTGATRQGSVVLSLTGLPDGDSKTLIIPVIQSDSAIGFDLIDYSPNTDYK